MAVAVEDLHRIRQLQALQLKCNENKYFDLNKQTIFLKLFRPGVGARLEAFNNNLFIYLLHADVLLSINHRPHHIRSLPDCIYGSMLATEKFF